MTVTYQYFRLLITGVYYEGNGGAVSIAEWKFFDGSGTQIGTTTGTASASSLVVGPAQNAFDGNLSTFWAGGVPTYASPVWLQYQFTSAVTVGSFSLTNRSDMQQQSPAEWILQGSNDGSTWTNIGRYSTTNWTSASQTQTFNIGTYGLSTAYRLNITATNGGSVAAIDEWKLFDGGGTQITTDVGVSATHGAAFSSTSIDASGNAFDGNTTTDYWASVNTPSSGSPQFLAYGFSAGSEPASVGSFSVTIRSDAAGSSQSPTAFSLENSTDGGSTWTTIQTYSATWTSLGQTLTFTVSGGGGSSIAFRRTRSALGTRAGSRQRTH